MKTKDLLELGLTEDQVDGVFRLRGKEIEAYKEASSNHEAEKAELNSKLEEAKEKIEKLSVGAISQEDLNKMKQQRDKYKALAKEVEEGYKNKIETLKYDTALERALENSGARDLGLVKSVLDKERIAFEDGELKGLDEHLSEVREQYGYLFKEDNAPSVPKFTNSPDTDSKQDNGPSNPFEDILNKYK